MAPAPGSLFAGRFEIESMLGRGASGTTYLARDQFRRQRVVLKLFASEDPEMRDLASAETSIGKALQHPNVLAVIDGGTADGLTYVVREWVDGATLDRVLDSGPLSLPDSMAAALAIAGALQAAHAQGIIHRDLKPANVLVPGWPQAPDYARVRLLDFGVAGVLKPMTQATQAGMIFGTPMYMSPEQVLGEPQTTATDVYALGLLLFEMLSGRPARGGSDLVTLFRSILNDPPPSLPPVVPERLETLVAQCLAREPKNRPQLGRIIEVLSGPRTLDNKLVVPSVVMLPPPRAARNPVWAAISVGLAFVAAVLIGFLLLAKGGTPVAGSESFPAIFGGLFLTGIGVGAGFWIRGLLGRSPAELRSHALKLALDAGQRTDLTATIAMKVTDLVGRLQQIDQQILAGTVALMLKEYQTSSEGKDRQAALMNVVALSEKLGQRLSPWYVRNKDVIATLVAVAGAVSGLLTAYNGLRHH